MIISLRRGVMHVLGVFIMAPSILLALPKAPPIEERVRELKLDNGLTIVVAERHNTPVFFTLSTFRVGSCQELPNRSGLAHFLEHMLFKGTKAIGTSDYKAEVPLMEKMEKVAEEMRGHTAKLASWRFEMFEEYALKVRAGLPQETLDKAASDESLLWRALLDTLPTDGKGLPAEWQNTPWVISDGQTDYWGLYRDIIGRRAELASLLQQQKPLLTATQPLNGIYDPRGADNMNAFTTQDQTTYMVGLPSNCLELWMYLESDRFQNPVFRQFYSEKEVVQEELRNRENDPESVLRQKFISASFDAHPYGRPVIGWQGDIRSTVRSDMEAFFWKYYTPNNCQITIVGDVNTDDVFRLAKQYFGKWKPGEPSPAVTVNEPEQDGEKRITLTRDAEPEVLIGYHIPTAPNPDAYALAMLHSILSGGRTTRFYKNIFEGKELTQGAPWAYDGPADRYPNLTIINANPKAPHTSAEVEAAIYEELDKLKNEPVTEWELERVKNTIRASELQRLASNRWLAFSLSGTFVQYGDWRQLKNEYERRLAVTPEDVQRVAKKYFVQENRIVATLIKGSGDQAEAPQTNGGRQ